MYWNSHISTLQMKSLIAFTSRYYLSIQAITLWVVALFYIQEFTFWYFAVAAIIVGGLSEILSELRKSKQDETK